MTTRILPVEEWERLDGTELEHVWPILHPEHASILVIEDGDRIVACWAVIRYVHVEGVWIDPEYRHKVGIVKRLLVGMHKIVESLGADRVLTGAVTEDVRQMIATLGGKKLPGDHYVIPLVRN